MQIRVPHASDVATSALIEIDKRYVLDARQISIKWMDTRKLSTPSSSFYFNRSSLFCIILIHYRALTCDAKVPVRSAKHARFYYNFKLRTSRGTVNLPFK